MLQFPHREVRTMWEQDLWEFLERIRPPILSSHLLPAAALKRRFRNPLEPDPFPHRPLPLVADLAVAHRPGSARPDSSTDSTTPTQPRGALRTLQAGPWAKP